MRRPLAVGLGAAAALAWRAERRYAARVAADPRLPDWQPLEPSEVLQVRSADGTPLHVEVSGRPGTPTVVLAHGWTCSALFWNRQVRALREDHRVVAFDLRGHARSGGDPAGFGPQALADDLQAVLEATVPDGERAVLVGHSMGAMAIVAWAGQHPDQVPRRASAALLLSTGVDRLPLDAAFVPLPPRLRGQVQRGVLGGPGVLAGRSAELLTRWFSVAPGTPHADVDLCARLMRATSPRSRVRWSRVIDRLDLLDDLQHLTVPTTLVVGTRDRLTPVTYARRMAERLPALVALVELEGVGHMTPLEAPDAVSDLVRRAAAERVAA